MNHRVLKAHNQGFPSIKLLSGDRLSLVLEAGITISFPFSLLAKSRDAKIRKVELLEHCWGNDVYAILVTRMDGKWIFLKVIKKDFELPVEVFNLTYGFNKTAVRCPDIYFEERENDQFKKAINGFWVLQEILVTLFGITSQ